MKYIYKIIISIILIIFFISVITYFEYNKQVNKTIMDNNSYIPTQDLSRTTADFNYPGSLFTFSYPLSVEKGSTTKEIEMGKTYEISISGGNNQKINIYLLPKDISDFFGEEINPYGFYYRQFIDDKKLTHLRMYGGKSMVDIIFNLSNPEIFIETIINSFQFTSENPLINK